MTYFVEVVAPMDQVFIGPFPTLDAAKDYARIPQRRGHDAFVVTAAEVTESQARYGAIPVQSPEGNQ